MYVTILKNLKTRDAQMFQKTRSHLKILDAKKGDKKQVLYWEPTKFRRSRKNLFATATRRPRFVNLWKTLILVPFKIVELGLWHRQKKIDRVRG